MPRTKALHEYFRPNPETGCWDWLPRGQVGSTGYPTKAICIEGGRGKKRYEVASRWVYKQLVGPIPEDLTIDHLCFNKRCVNPDHLEVVPFRENLARRKHLARGERHGRAKLSELEVRELRMAAPFSVSPTDLADHYGISYFGARLINQCENWRHVQ